MEQYAFNFIISSHNGINLCISPKFSLSESPSNPTTIIFLPLISTWSITNNNKSLKSQTIDGKVYAGRTCKAVGQGVLSRLVVFANKLFANIAGKSTQSKTDLVVIDSGMGDVSSFRNSWREGNF